MKKITCYLLTISLVFTSCSVYKKTTATDDGRITINLVQINDVYEIAPLNGGREGGIARVSALKKKYVENNPNTLLVLAGDFLSPSVYNSLKQQGESIKGKQMVASLNAAGLDLAIFGNHEFDIREKELQQRINESSFQWIASNTFHKKADKVMPFEKSAGSPTSAPFPKVYIRSFSDADGTTAKIGFIALTLPFNKAPYVYYEDALESARKLCNQIKDSVDAIVALTHQSMDEDEILAAEIPAISLILGGHEHDGRYKKYSSTLITKSPANARAAYVHLLQVNKKTRLVKTAAKLEALDERAPLDSAANAVVQQWVSIANSSYAALGFDPGMTVISTMEPLDGREAEVRSHPTNLGKLIINAMMFAAPSSDAVIMNTGSIRVDDILHMPVSQYDILRTLPYGGSIRELEMKGSLLKQVLDAGEINRGTGGYLIYNDALRYDAGNNTWKLNDTPIDPLRSYRIAITDFLLTGGEANLGFLVPGNKDIIKVYDAESSITDPRSDIRRAVIKYLQQKK